VKRQSESNESVSRLSSVSVGYLNSSEKQTREENGGVKKEGERRRERRRERERERQRERSISELRLIFESHKILRVVASGPALTRPSLIKR
jgi:hypothetical protein